jgi:hypothetical protein
VLGSNEKGSKLLEDVVQFGTGIKGMAAVWQAPRESVIYFDFVVGGQLHICGLQVSMNDPAFMRRFVLPENVISA